MLPGGEDTCPETLRISRSSGARGISGQEGGQARHEGREQRPPVLLQCAGAPSERRGARSGVGGTLLQGSHLLTLHISAEASRIPVTGLFTWPAPPPPAIWAPLLKPL